MAFSKVKQHIDELSKDIQAYINHRLEYFELVMLKEVSDTSADIIRAFLLTIFFVVFMAFVSVGFALLLGGALDNYSAGFFIMGGVYLLIFILILLFGKKIFQSTIVKALSKKIMKYKKK